MRVRDCMSENVVTITPEESAALAARLMTRHNLGVLAVCDYHGKLQGVVTDRDIITRCVAVDQDPSRVPVADIMSAQVETHRTGGERPGGDRADGTETGAAAAGGGSWEAGGGGVPE